MTLRILLMMIIVYVLFVMDCVSYINETKSNQYN